MPTESNNNGLMRLLLKGNAYERGVQHGHRLKQYIRPRVDNMWLKAENDLQHLRDSISNTIDLVNDICEDIVEEIKGIADGSELEFEKVFLYNNRDIWQVLEGESCTMLAVRNGDSVVVGMNKDAPVNNADKYIFQQSFPEKGFALLGYGHVGRVWGHGINEHGLCTAGTAVMGRISHSENASIGIYLLPRIILNKCRCVSEALDLIDNIPRISGGANFMVADENGEAVIIELTPSTRNIRKIKQNRIYAANNFLSDEENFGPEGQVLKESLMRADFVDEMLNRLSSDNNISELKKTQLILSAHETAVSVCRHNVLGFSTALSWTVSLKERKLYMCNGNPCKNKFRPMN